MVWLWLVVLFISLTLFVLTKKVLLLPLCFSSLVSMILAIFKVEIITEVVVFLLLFVLIYALQFVFLKKYACSASHYTTESVVGQRCIVVEKIDNFAGCGLVKVGSQLWSARGAFEDDTFDLGENLTVVAIEGVKLICKKI